MAGAGIHIVTGGKRAAGVAADAAGLAREAGGGSSVLLAIVRLVLDVGSCAAFVPALRCVFLRRRHFESFIGVFQLVSALAYTITDCTGWATLLLVASDDWHRLSDIMSETYVCLIAIHLMGLRDEDHMTLLRYIAFALVWLAKLADGWGSIVFEVTVLTGFIFVPVVLALREALTELGVIGAVMSSSGGEDDDSLKMPKFLTRRLGYDKEWRGKAAMTCGVGVVCLFLELTMETTIKLWTTGAHVCFGAAAFCLWKLVPCYDKHDVMPSFR